MTSPEESRTQRLAEAAFKRMAERNIVPTPQNYALWYAHVSGSSPELSKAINTQIDSGRPFTVEFSADLYGRHFDANGQLNALQESGGRLQAVMDQVRRMVETAAGESSSFGQRLDSFSSAISGGNGKQVRALITELMQETQAVARRNKALEERLNRASGEVARLRENLETVQREALTDALTGIPNRKFFDARLQEAARDCVENDEPLSLLIADIDHFKRFNDTYGHQLGDQVLRLVARTLSDSVKGRDTPARFGGEEFVIILPQTRLKDARIVAEQIRNTLARRKVVGSETGEEYGIVTLSFGAAQFRPGEPLTDMIERADAALYLAKREGRNRVATEEMLPVPTAKAS
jgi:diguanylate cyclase